MAIKAFSKQHVFDRVWNGLKEQGFVQSKVGDSQCTYRGDEGRKCAAGHLIPDEEYKPWFEGHGITYIKNTLGCDYGPQPTGLDCRQERERRAEILNLMRALQSAHDCGDDPWSMKALLRQVAIRHDLTIPGEEA